MLLLIAARNNSEAPGAGRPGTCPERGMMLVSTDQTWVISPILTLNTLNFIHFRFNIQALVSIKCFLLPFQYVVKCLNGSADLQSATVQRCTDISNQLVSWLTGCHRLIFGTHITRLPLALAWLFANLGYEQCGTYLKVVAINSGDKVEDHTSTMRESLNSSERD